MRVCLLRSTVRRIAATLAVAGALTAADAAAQVVTAPTLDGATLRVRLGPTMAPPGRALPADAAALDAMVTQGQFTALAKRLSETRDPNLGMLDLNWEQARLFDGAGFLVALSYLNDLWRMGAALPGPAGDEMKQSAGMVFAYALTLIAVDGVRCADVSAPGHRQDQLVAQNRPLLAYVKALPRDRRMMLGTIALAIEGATASVRRNDAVLCSGGLDEISAGLAAQGDRPLAVAPAAKGQIGRTYLVPAAPGYAPRFVAPAVWQPRQATARAAMPARLTALLSFGGADAGAKR